jgi:putative oxygen-independent coproporphyrinogen III oxidase
MSPPSASLDPITGVEAARLGLYVHFPYCLSKCPYCDFASTVSKRVPQERYAQAVLSELDLRPSPTAPVESIFFGGGTPSLWEPRHVGEVLEGISKRLSIAPGAEVTLEANPGASDASRFAAYRRLGVNRLSIGVQSFQPSTLKALGREHDGPMAESAFAAARAAGFDNVSCDFIYGVQGQTREGVEADARRAVALGSEHLSAYALTLEKEALAEEVPLAKQLARGEVVLPPDDEVVAMAGVVRDIYASAGLQRYEISNYARPGFHSRHNALYWTGGEYLAAGVGATGFLDGERWSNLRSADQYLAAVEKGERPEASREQLTVRERFEERLAMGLRLSAGVDLAAVCERFGESLSARLPEVERLQQHALATYREGRLQLTNAGLDLHSAISARLF